jgi:hypothetical protein
MAISTASRASHLHLGEHDLPVPDDVCACGGAGRYQASTNDDETCSRWHHHGAKRSNMAGKRCRCSPTDRSLNSFVKRHSEAEQIACRAPSSQCRYALVHNPGKARCVGLIKCRRAHGHATRRSISTARSPLLSRQRSASRQILFALSPVQTRSARMGDGARPSMA